MEIPLLIETLQNYYVDNPMVTSAVIAILTTLCIIAYDVLNNLATKRKKPTVKELNIYPIKSCAESRVSAAAISPRGFQNDRVFQVVSKVNNKWCFCTPREKAFVKLFHVKPTLSIDEEGIKLKLSSPHRKGNFTLDLEDAVVSPLKATVMCDHYMTLVDYGDAVSKWLADATDIVNPRLVSIPPGDEYRRNVKVNPDQGEKLPASSPFPVSLADEAPFLLTTRESLDALNKRLKVNGSSAVDMRRFRPNIVLDGLEPWEEDSLKRIKIGNVEFHVWQRCGRCTMTTIDRDTLKRKGGEPLKTLSTFRERKNGQRNFGMHLIPVIDKDARTSGLGIAEGDEVEILEYDNERRAEWMQSRMQIFGDKQRRAQKQKESTAPKKSWREKMKECPFKDSL